MDWLANRMVKTQKEKRNKMKTEKLRVYVNGKIETHGDWQTSTELFDRLKKIHLNNFFEMWHIYGIFYFKNGIGEQNSKYVIGDLCVNSGLRKSFLITATSFSYESNSFMDILFCDEMVDLEPDDDFMFIEVKDPKLISFDFCVQAVNILNDRLAEQKLG
jgi:hypothetical protein